MRREAVRVPGRMSTRIVEPGEEHREQIARLLSTSVNFPLERALANAPHLRMKDIRVAIDDDMVVATAGEFRFHQWFGGRGVDCCGITRVAVAPERRAGGLATACTDAVLSRARDRGTPIASLFPAVLRPYRRMGFEIAGGYHEHRVALDALPPAVLEGGTPSVELVDADRDLGDIRAAYREWIRHANGPVEPVDDEHWRVRVLSRTGDDAYRTVVVREGGRVTGFAAFSRVDAPGHLDVSFGLACELMFTITPGAAAALLSYFRGHRGLGTWLEWAGPAAPVALAVPDALVRREFTYDWMLRLLHVPAALEARGYPAIDATAAFAVQDERWPGNTGPWRIEVRDGTAQVTPTGDLAQPPRPISIGALSSMFAGHLEPHDAVRLGLLDPDDPAVDAFAAMFSGSDPWCPLFF
jgi:predicted acetyltransferase